MVRLFLRSCARQWGVASTCRRTFLCWCQRSTELPVGALGIAHLLATDLLLAVHFPLQRVSFSSTLGDAFPCWACFELDTCWCAGTSLCGYQRSTELPVGALGIAHFLATDLLLA